MEIFDIQVSYTFTGNVKVEADTCAEGIRIVTEDFGCVLDGCSTSNDQHVKDWDISTHPDHSTIGPLVADTSNLSEKAEALKEANGGHWGELAGHDVADWRYEVANEDTKLGYWEWAANRIDSGEFD